MKGQVLGGQKLQVTLFTAHDGPAAKRKGDLSDLLYYESSTGQFWVPISPVAHLRSRYPNPALARVCAGSAPESSSSQSWTDSSAGGNISNKKPSYTTTSSGNLVNITKGAFRTEARSIHISNLPHGTKAINLQQFLDESGLGGKLIMSRSSAKDSATVCYESCEKARKAVEAFDQKSFRGKKLRVKLDTETIQVAREEPKPSKPLPKPKSKGIRRLVVDGSTPIP
ncbi:MAG: hypothetical protein M1825_005384 [Sarcosagium campestre]|nr:MAG: hypothetical protein M1825_005384 [Sarcosagium campestre]